RIAARAYFAAGAEIQHSAIAGKSARGLSGSSGLALSGRDATGGNLERNGRSNFNGEVAALSRPGCAKDRDVPVAAIVVGFLLALYWPVFRPALFATQAVLPACF